MDETLNFAKTSPVRVAVSNSPTIYFALIDQTILYKAVAVDVRRRTRFTGQLMNPPRHLGGYDITRTALVRGLRRTFFCCASPPLTAISTFE
jgi:hypothetical protein